LTPRIFSTNVIKSDTVKSETNFIVGNAVKLNYKIKSALDVNVETVKFKDNIIYIPVDFDANFFDENSMKLLKYNNYIYKVWYLCKNKKYKIYVTEAYFDIFGIPLEEEKRKKMIEKVFNKEALNKMYEKSQKYYKISSSRYKRSDDKKNK